MPGASGFPRIREADFDPRHGLAPPLDHERAAGARRALGFGSNGVGVGHAPPAPQMRQDSAWKANRRLARALSWGKLAARFEHFLLQVAQRRPDCEAAR